MLHNNILKKDVESLRDPTLREINTPLFNAIWNCIKKWEIATGLDKDDGGNDLYSDATGNHVVAIIDAIKADPKITITKNPKNKIGFIKKFLYFLFGKKVHSEESQ